MRDASHHRPVRCPVTFDGCRLDSAEAVHEWLADLAARRSSGPMPTADGPTPDFARLIAALNRHGIEYLLSGGAADHLPRVYRDSDPPLIPVTIAGMELDSALPCIDEHETSINVPAAVAWTAVLAVVGRLTTRPAWRMFAKAVRCKPDRAIGAGVTVGEALPGFLVARCEAPTEWALEGEHLFSRYVLTFRIAPVDSEQCRVAAHSSAEFPGPHGKIYRAMVIGSGGHAIGVRSILRSIKTDAEHSGH